ncbi:MAG: helix-turn-helix domain-containing protein [Gracilibacteraceae bacterium]|jgi:transcriptional regulator with XRE-family HTH domain|nr:helix-turn-helix domain-containing protein [Gracilibacteraceae bacterium]
MAKIAGIIGERLRVYRNRAGLSQEKLAEKANLHNTYIGQLERGEKNATLESIEKVARALDLPFEILFANIIVSERKSEIAAECYNIIAVLSEKEQKILLNIIKTVIEFKQ